jgi:putative phosphoribosyl transferase
MGPTPTLLIVGGYDTPVIGMNQEAMTRLRTEKQLVIVPGASHLFEEPGTLDKVFALAADWFRRYLGEAVENPFPVRNTQVFPNQGIHSKGR